MIKAFIINLERSPDRRAFMEKQMIELGIDYEFITSTDGSKFSDDEIEKLYDRDRSLSFIQEPLQKNEIAAAHSHVKVYEAILEQNLEYALVLEDDIILDKRILKVLQRSFLQKYSFDWLQLGYGPVGLTYLKSWMKTSVVRMRQRPSFFFYAMIKFPYVVAFCIYEGVRDRWYKKSLAIGYFARPLYLSSAYVVTPKGIRKMLSLAQPILFASDMLPNKARRFTKLKMKASLPCLASQDCKTFPSITRG